jgi:hypothetical protein
VVAGEAGVGVVRQPVAAEDHAGVLHGAVQVQQPGADRRRSGVVRSAPDQRVEPAGVRRRVVVEQDDQLGTSRLDARVAGSAEAEVDGLAEHADAVAVRRQHLRCVVRGGVVDDEDAAGGRQVLRQQGVQAVAGQSGPAVHRDDDGDAGAARGAGHAPTSAVRRARSR